MTGDPFTAIAAVPAPPSITPISTLGEPWLSSAADLIATLAEHRDQPRDTLVPTGHPELDRRGGLAPGTLTALAAAPGPAATAALVAAAYHAAYHHRLATLVYPLRSTLPQIAEQVAAAHLGESPGAGTASRAAAEMRDCPLYVTVGSPITVTRIHFDAIDPEMAAPSLIVVDGVDLLLPAGAARDLKHLALELNVAILCSTTVHRRVTGAATGGDVGADISAAADTIVTIEAQPTPADQPSSRRPTTIG